MIFFFVLAIVSGLNTYKADSDDLPSVSLRPKPKARGGGADADVVQIFSVTI